MFKIVGPALVAIEKGGLDAEALQPIDALIMKMH
jgi:hypothetical protein